MDFILKDAPTVNGIEVAQSKVYNHLEINGTHWLWAANVPNPGDYIYCRGTGLERSRGFGGSTLTFKLVDGKTLSLQGPWHSNSKAMFRETGIDIRDKHYTFGVISRDYDYNKGNGGIMKDVLYQDNDWKISEYSRIQDMAKEWAQKLGRDVAYYQSGLGGSCRGWGRV